MKIGKKYTTKCGNIVECKSKVSDKFACQYIAIKATGHEVLQGTTQLWEDNGRWSKTFGRVDSSIHDIEEV